MSTPDSSPTQGYAIVLRDHPKFGNRPEYRGIDRVNVSTSGIDELDPEFPLFLEYTESQDEAAWLRTAADARRWLAFWRPRAPNSEVIAFSRADDLEPSWPLLGYDIWGPGVAPLAWSPLGRTIDPDDPLADMWRREDELFQRMNRDLNAHLLFDSRSVADAYCEELNAFDDEEPGVWEGQRLAVYAVRVMPETVSGS